MSRIENGLATTSCSRGLQQSTVRSLNKGMYPDIRVNALTKVFYRSQKDKFRT